MGHGAGVLQGHGVASGGVHGDGGRLEAKVECRHFDFSDDCGGVELKARVARHLAAAAAASAGGADSGFGGKVQVWAVAAEHPAVLGVCTRRRRGRPLRQRDRGATA